jgi:hypothetical protein
MKLNQVVRQFTKILSEEPSKIGDVALKQWQKIGAFDL